MGVSLERDAPGQAAVSNSGQKHGLHVQPSNDELFERVVASYKTWLTTQTQQHRQGIAQHMLDYEERAMQAVEVQQKRIQTFAPFRYKYSALQTITRKQSGTLVVLALGWFAALAWNWHLTLAVTISAITIGYLSHLVLDSYLAIQATRHDAEEHIDGTLLDALKDADWPPYTILCPLYKEARVVPQFVSAMRALDYPAEKLQILFLTEEDDNDTRRAILSLHLPSHFRIVTVPDGAPRTKPRACNYGLIEATGLYVVIYDAEDVPDPLQLKKAVLTFANHGPDLACVQAKLNFYNPQQNILTRWFTAEYSLWFDLILPGLQKAGLAIPLGGTSNHFPAQTLRALGAWDAFNVTEDCDLGLRLSWFHLKTVIVDSTTLEEANSRPKNWIRQRSRWIKGYMQTYLVHMRKPQSYFQQKRLREFFSLQVVIGGKTAFLLLNPVMWILLAVNIFAGKALFLAFVALFPPFMLYIGLITLVLGNFFYAYSYLLGCMKREQYALVKWMLLIPIYWGMASVAAYMALYELCTRPHYWQKTIHGLHLSASTQVAGTDDPEWESLAQLAEQFSPLSGSSGIELLHGHGPSQQLQRYEKLEYVPVPSVQDSVSTMIMHHNPALLPSERDRFEQRLHSRRDPWLWIIVGTAFVLSIAAYVTFLRLGELPLTQAVTSTLLSFDITNAGKGNVWLPLSHIAGALFTSALFWNADLQHSGLGASLPSMLFYVLAALYLYKSIHLLTGKSMLAYLCVLTFMLNPVILYFQSISTTLLMATAFLTMICYYLLAWSRTQHLGHLLELAGVVCLSTLVRYDFWVMYVGILMLIVGVGALKRQPRARVASNLLVFGIPGGLGICAWIAWCWSISGNPLFFLNGSRTVQTLATQSRLLLPNHSAWQLLQFYGQAAFEVLGPLVVIALIAVVYFLARRGRSLDMVLLLAVLLPVVVTFVFLYNGQFSFIASPDFSGGIQNRLFQLRLGAELVVPATILIGSLLGGWKRKASIMPV